VITEKNEHMKDIRILFIQMLAVLTLFTGCDLTMDLDDVDPGFVIPKSQVVTDAESAELLVIGAYTTLKTKRKYSALPEFTSYAGLSGEASTYSWAIQRREIYNNNPGVENTSVKTIYVAIYESIQQANLAIETIGAVSDDVVSAGEKDAFIAELKFIRANNNLNLLRLFGEFYDLSSNYGISLRETSATSAELAVPRVTVQATYNAILADLDDAVIANIQDRGVNYRVSQEAAKALKAKVHLYMKNYPDARDLAKEIIAARESGLDLTEEDAFDKDLNFYNNVAGSIGVMFAPFNNYPEDEYGSYPPINVGDSYYGTVGVGDPRENVAKGFYQFDNEAGDYQPPFYRASHVFMRLAEVYLIHAEAAARAAGGGVPLDALASLNEVRTREALGLPPVAPADYAALLEAIRLEKVLELRHENGEDLTDIIRYHIAGDIDASTIKATLNDVGKFIWPIPLDDITLAKDQAGVVIEQNPGYVTE